MEQEVEIAKCFLKCEEYTLVVVKQWPEVVSSDSGLLPLLMVYDNCPAKLEGSVVADKVIGKAAALILTYAGIKEVYGQIMSRKALPVLAKGGIRYSYGELVPDILDRNGTDICPLEKLCRQIDEPLDGIMAITAYLCRKECGYGHPKDHPGVGRCN